MNIENFDIFLILQLLQLITKGTDLSCNDVAIV